MTPIEKARIAFKQILRTTLRKGAAGALDDIHHIATEALSDLSSLKLEDGDVEWLADILNVEARFHLGRDQPLDEYEIAQNARIDRLIAFLGHGGA